jgi:hypothetical protein
MTHSMPMPEKAATKGRGRCPPLDLDHAPHPHLLTWSFHSSSPWPRFSYRSKLITAGCFGIQYWPSISTALIIHSFIHSPHLVNIVLLAGTWLSSSRNYQSQQELINTVNTSSNLLPRLSLAPTVIASEKIQLQYKHRQTSTTPDSRPCSCEAPSQED